MLTFNTFDFIEYAPQVLFSDLFTNSRHYLRTIIVNYGDRTNVTQ